MSRYLEYIKVKKKGFTLIETITVIAIIGILSAIITPSMAGYLNTANNYKKNANAKAFYTAAQAAVTSLEASGIILDGESFTSSNSLEQVENIALFSRIRKFIGVSNYEGFDEMVVNIKDGAVTSVNVREKGSTEKVIYPPSTAQDEDSENNDGSDSGSDDSTDSDDEDNGNNSGNNGDDSGNNSGSSGNSSGSNNGSNGNSSGSNSGSNGNSSGNNSGNNGNGSGSNSGNNGNGSGSNSGNNGNGSGSNNGNNGNGSGSNNGNNGNGNGSNNGNNGNNNN